MFANANKTTNEILFHVSAASIQPVYSQYTASIQPVYSQYTAGIQPVYSRYTAGIQPVYSRYTAGIQPVYNCLHQIKPTVADDWSHIDSFCEPDPT